MAKIIVSDAGGERELSLDKDVITIGRVAQDNDVEIKVPEASRHHCKLVREGKAWFVEDLGSSNGTRVNGRRVGKFELADGDEIQVGVATLRYLESAAVAAPVEDEVELEISLTDDPWVRFLDTARKGEQVTLSGRTTIGRRSTCDLHVDERGVSATHAEIVPEGGEWIVRDLGSTNGIFVDGEKVAEATLRPGTRLRIGPVALQFGIGEDEGEGVVVEELAGGAAGREVFAISEGNLRRKQRTAFAAWLLIVGLAGVGIWLWLSQEGGAAERRREPQHVAGNLIARGASFEVEEGLDDYLATDSDALQYEETQQRVNSGDWALDLDSGGAAGTHELLFTDRIVNLAPAERLEIGAHVRTAGLSGGVGGLCIVWLDESGLRRGASHLNAPVGSSEFEELRGTFTAPDGARAAQVGVAITDATGGMQVDDVFALRRGGDAGEALAIAGFQADLDPSGAFALTRDNAPIGARGGFWIRGADGAATPTFSRFVRAAATRSESAVALEGELVIDGAGRATRLEIAATDDGLRWSGTIESAEAGAEGAEAGALVLALELILDEGLVTIGAGGTVRHLEAFRREGVGSMVLGSGARAAQLDLEAPAVVTVIEDRGPARLEVPLFAREGGQGFDVAIQLDFESERGESTRVYEAAERADLVDKRYGEAMRGYREVIDRFPYRRDLVTRAEARLAELTSQGERTLAELAARADRITFFGTHGRDYDPFVADVAAAAERFEGADVAARMRALVQDLGERYAAMQTEDRIERAKNHLLRGQDLMTEGRSMPVLAKGFFLSVLALAPETEMAETARAELERIAPITGR